MQLIQDTPKKVKQELQYNDVLSGDDVWHIPLDAIIRVSVRIVKLGATLQHFVRSNKLLLLQSSF